MSPVIFDVIKGIGETLSAEKGRNKGDDPEADAEDGDTNPDDTGGGDGLGASPLRADSPEWKAMGKDERKAYLADRARSNELRAKQSIRDLLTSFFSTTPLSANFQAYDEHRSIFREIATKNSIELVRPHNPDHAAERELQETAGVTLAYYRGGKGDSAGFVSGLAPGVIFLSTEQSRYPTGWVITHEMVHVAQKDPRFTAGGIYRKTLSLMSQLERTSAIRHLRQAGYHRSDMRRELPAHIIADAAFGEEVFVFDNIAKGQALKTELADWFDSLGEIKPDILKDIPDDPHPSAG